MNRTVLAVVAALVVATLALLGFALLSSDGGGPGGGADPATNAPANRAPESRGTEAHETGAAEPARVERTEPAWLLEEFGEGPADVVDPTTTGIVTGRLAWQDGMPIAGARVRLQRAARDTVVPEPGDDVLAPDDDPAATTTTQHNGAFELTGVPPRERLFLRFELGDGSVEIEDLRVTPAVGARAWQGEYLLPARGSVRGVLVDEDGETVRGATIRAVDELRFDDPGVPDDVREQRIAGAETRTPDSLEAGRTMSARERRYMLQLPYPSARSRGDGTFEIRGVREGTNHLLIQHETLVARRIDVPVFGGKVTDVGVVALGRGAAFVVRLLDPDLHAIAGCDVAIQPSGWRFGPPAATTDANGEARLRLDTRIDDDTPCAILVRRGRGKPWAVVGSAALPGASVVLQTDDTATLHLDTGNGPPWTGVRIRARPEVQGLRASVVGNRVELDGLPPEASCTLYVLADGYMPERAVVGPVPTGPQLLPLELTDELLAAWKPAIPSPRPPRIVRLYPMCAATLVVVDEQGRAVPGAVVSFFEGMRVNDAGKAGARQSGRWLGVTDDAGALRAEGLAARPLTFSVWHAARGGVGMWVDPLAPNERLTIPLVTPARVTGTILEGGQPVARRYAVRLSLPRLIRVPERVPFQLGPHVVESDDTGRFEYPRVAPWPLPGESWGATVFEPQPPDSGNAFRSGFQPRVRSYWNDLLPLQVGQTVDLPIELSDAKDVSASAIVGTVRLGLEAVRGVLVEIWDTRGQTSLRQRGPRTGPSGGRGFEAVQVPVRIASTHTDATGRFEFGESWPRDHEIRVTIVRAGHAIELTRVACPAARPSRNRKVEPIVIDLPVGDLVLALFDATGSPLVHRPLWLISDDGVRRYPSLTDDLGTAREVGLVAGSYTIVVADRTGQPLKFAGSIEVVAGDTAYERRTAQ